jgi:hypothetical protein
MLRIGESDDDVSLGNRFEKLVVPTRLARQGA